ncbi:MAG: ECF transporter S component [Anaerotignaceae bacterium]
MERVLERRKPTDITKMVKIGMLSAVSIVLMMFEVPLPIFPSFLQMDISDLPALIGAVSMGPVAGILIELIKNLLHLFKTSTAGVGEIANFLVGVALVVPIGVCYKNKKTLGSFIMGAIMGAIAMIVLACIFNYYVLIPAFSVAFGAPIEAFVEIANKVNSSVVDLKTMIIFAVAPFNLVKAIVVSAVGYPVCKLLKNVL